MAGERQCSKCGTTMPVNAPKGLCPRCLLAAALRPTPSTPAPAIGNEAPNAGDPFERIDRYKILQKIGEGGCGVVYLAEQITPVRRRVALKVIKLGMDTRQVIARFDAERQALALMDHPNIAKALDAGATETGRPFFVMELVQGVPITTYCDQQHLSPAKRLDLFSQVCHAIQHAHQKGIIHRDIKPSNILVAIQDGKPVPKVIDFGIAKATEQPLTDLTVFTALGQFMGTPAYMSPEQAQSNGLDIDTRSDIYALGVLLYELLTGRTPFDARDLLKAGVDEMRRRIREEEPLRPSTRLSTMLDADLTHVARHRHADPAQLTRFIRGDLDWIVMKCLEKDRSRRYETALSIATEIQRHLNNEPVLACPPGKLYCIQKMLRRNRVFAAAACVVLLSLLSALGTAMWSFVKEKQARQRAMDAEQRSRSREAIARAAQEEAEAQLRVFSDGQIFRKHPPTTRPRPLHPSASAAPVIPGPAASDANSPAAATSLKASPDLSTPPTPNITTSNRFDLPAASPAPGAGVVPRPGLGASNSSAAYVVSPALTDYGKWAAEWWRWSLELPWVDPSGAVHPFIDSAAFDVRQGQLGDVWFLAAPFGEVNRICTIPSDKFIFFPVLNVEVSTLDLPPFFAKTAEEQAAQSAYFASRVEGLYCDINGLPVPNLEAYRIRNPQIAFDAPTPWIYGDVGGRGTSVGEGYYLMLRPLERGNHTLRFGGAFVLRKPEDPLDIYAPVQMTYHINVE